MKTKTVKLTQREVGWIRCWCITSIRSKGVHGNEASDILSKMNKLWKDPLYNGYMQEVKDPLDKGKKNLCLK